MCKYITVQGILYVVQNTRVTFRRTLALSGRCRSLRPVMSRVVVLSCKAIIISPQRRALAAEMVGCFLKQMPQGSLKAAALFLR